MKERWLNRFKEIFSYGFWGCMTVLFSLVSYSLLKIVIYNYTIANFFSIVFTKIFAYIVNKKFVFHTKNNFVNELKEIGKYILARGFTGIVDWVGQIILVEMLYMEDIIAKVMMIIITTILNYFLCSFAVFKGKS